MKPHTMKERFYLTVILICVACHEETATPAPAPDPNAGPCTDAVDTIWEYREQHSPRADQRGEVVPGSGGWNEVRAVLFCKCVRPVPPAVSPAPSASTR